MNKCLTKQCYWKSNVGPEPAHHLPSANCGVNCVIDKKSGRVVALKKFSAEAINKHSKCKARNMHWNIGLTNVRDLLSSLLNYKLYIPGPQFNNVAIVSNQGWKCSARKACLKGGKLKPSIQICKAAKTISSFAVNKRLVWNRFALHTAGRYVAS